jgi:hypothetical protein
MMNPLSLFTLSQLKSWLKIGPTDDGPDAVLEILGNAASDYCEARIGATFKSRDYTIARDGDGRDRLLRLPRPISAVSALSIDGVALDASDYVVYGDKGKIRLKTRLFGGGVGNVSVTLTAGYADGDLPNHVVGAALDLAKAHYEEWTNGAISLSSINVGSMNAIIKPGLNPRIEKYLDSQRDVRG